MRLVSCNEDEYSHEFVSFMKRSDIVGKTNNILRDGALFIHVHVLVQVKGRSDDLYQTVKDISKNQLQLLRSDVVFKVGGRSFLAHLQILCANAPLLSESCDEKGSSAVTIKGIHQDVFQYVLEHIYAGVVPPVELVLDLGKKLIHAGNRYEHTFLPRISHETTHFQPFTFKNYLLKCSSTDSTHSTSSFSRQSIMPSPLAATRQSDGLTHHSQSLPSPSPPLQQIAPAQMHINYQAFSAKHPLSTNWPSCLLPKLATT
jgi:hypothetical protein